jgi:rhodanese-related sulfurtransferase
MSMNVEKPVSRVQEFPAANPAVARSHFAAKLAVETDPWDVNEDMKNGTDGIVVLDARSPEAFAKEHIKGAANLHHRKMDAASTAFLSKEKTIVVYCTGVSCNASTKGALKLASLGFKVKELIGGLEAWKKEGYPTEQG